MYVKGLINSRKNMMGSSNILMKKRKIRSIVRNFLLVLILISLGSLFYIIYFSLESKSEDNNKLNLTKKIKNLLQLSNSESFNIFSLKSSYQEYHNTIEGLLYDYDKHIKETGFTHINVKEPLFYTIKQIIEMWPTDDTSPSKWPQSLAYPQIKTDENGNTYNSGIVRLDYSDEEQRKNALEFREAEIPFIIYNVDDLKKAEEEFTLPNLIKNFGITPRSVEKSKDNHFIYYSLHKTSNLFDSWKPPQEDVFITFGEFLKEAEKAENSGDIHGDRSLHYMTISATEGISTPWIKNSFPFFKAKESFFIVDPNGFKGINCRLGMKGVIAAAHYDGARNFVAMVRGRKRYILLPPEECNKLDLLPKGHPSGRHSNLNWKLDSIPADKLESFSSARATEVVLSRGEMLYIPSYWFHYIVSQDASIQCNARSGSSDVGFEKIADCGNFYDNKTKPAAKKKKRKMINNENAYMIPNNNL